MKLSLKASLLMVSVAGLPLAVGGPTLVELNRKSVVESEERTQSATLGEVSASISAMVGAVRSDAEAVAAALAEAAANPRPQGDGLGSVRAVLATRRSLDAARFEVPGAGVSTPLTKKDAGEPPRSTDELRAQADARGVALAIAGPDLATMVVPIDMGAGAKGAKGYVAVAVRLEKLREELGQSVLGRFSGKYVDLLLVDEQKRVIAAAGSAPMAQGEDASRLPIFTLLPAGIPWSKKVSVVNAHSRDGVAMVGAVQTIPEQAWAVALWRPEADAYEVLHATRRRVIAAAAAAAAAALLAALLASRALTRPILELVEVARRLGRREWAAMPQAPSRSDELGELEAALGQAARDLERGEGELARQERVRADLGRFLSRDLVDKIVRGEHSLALGGGRQEVSVIFADVVAFTPLAESKPPEQVVALLNELFSMLTEIVFRHGGTVDKFIGDCIMAVWGAAAPCDDHAARALDAAGDMLRFLETANEGWKTRYGVTVRLGIGVNSGAAIVGNIGSDKRMEFTVIGDVVNVAARLEAIAAPDQILVSEATQRLVGDAFELNLLGERKLTGRAQSTQVYELAL